MARRVGITICGSYWRSAPLGCRRQDHPFVHGAAVMRLRVALGYSVSAALSAKREIAGYVGSCDGFDYSVERRFPQAADWLPLGRQSVLLWKMSHGSASCHNVPRSG